MGRLSQLLDGCGSLCIGVVDKGISGYTPTTTEQHPQEPRWVGRDLVRQRNPIDRTFWSESLSSEIKRCEQLWVKCQVGHGPSSLAVMSGRTVPQRREGLALQHHPPTVGQSAHALDGLHAIYTVGLLTA